MNDIKLNSAPGKTPAQDAPKETPTQDEPKKAPAPKTEFTSAPFKGKIPAQWIITPADEDTITAINHKTRESFEGTMAEFNHRLRG